MQRALVRLCVCVAPGEPSASTTLCIYLFLPPFVSPLAPVPVFDEGRFSAMDSGLCTVDYLTRCYVLYHSHRHNDIVLFIKLAEG